VLLEVARLSALPVASARRLVRRAIEFARGDLRSIDFGHVESVVALAAGLEGGRTQIPGLDVCRSFEWIRIAPGGGIFPYRFSLTVPACVPVPGTGFSLALELIDKSETIATGDSVYNSEMGYLDWSQLSGNLELRNWLPGDRYQPAGASGTRKIADLFQNARVPIWERGRWPVLTDGSEIIWTRRFGPSAARAAGPGIHLVLAIKEVTAR
jgi:tRNA(Ile)-lysidine synthase